MHAGAVTVSACVPIAAATAFAGIAAIDLPGAFVGYGPLPAVTGIADGALAWQSVGQARTLKLADGSTAVETLTAIAEPDGFGYRVDQYSSILRYLVDHAEASWRFASTPGGCEIHWRYRYFPRSWLAAPLVWAITQTLWRGYMRRSIARCAAIIS